MFDRPSITSNVGVSSNSDDLVCDYDTNATLLYAFLQSLEWDAARSRCQSHPKEVRTWVVKVDPLLGKTRWKLLPLHAALVFQAPLSVIECLLNEYPNAAKEPDDKGLLPLHLAFRHRKDDEDNDDAALGALLDEYPQGVATKDKGNRLPIDFASEGMHFSISFLKKYSNAYAKHQELKQVEAAKALNKVKMDNLQTAHEEKVSAIEKEHKQALRHLKQELLQKQHSIRSQHHEEMDDLRDLLSREVASGQNMTKLARNVKELEKSFEEEKEKCRKLELILEEHNRYESELSGQTRKLLSDQQSIHASYLEQQRQLKEAQQFREQILSSLLISEDGKVLEKSREIRELSEQLEFRTEKLMSFRR